MSSFPADLEFNKLLAGRSDIDLVQLMLEIAADAYPDLDRLGVLMEIDRLAAEVCRDVGDWRERPRSARERLSAVSRVLYEIEGFHGNHEAYYEPENSYLNQVLVRRCGIPISLGILYMTVATRVGLRMFGTNMPAHFVVGCYTQGSPLFVDAFHAGDILDRDDCRRRVEGILGQEGVVTPEHFRPATPVEITARVLRNLKAAYAMQSCWAEALPIQRRLAALLPDVAEEARDLGLISLKAGQPREAIKLLESYRARCSPGDAAVLESSIRAARKMLAELN